MYALNFLNVFINAILILVPLLILIALPALFQTVVPAFWGSVYASRVDVGDLKHLVETQCKADQQLKLDSWNEGLS